MVLLSVLLFVSFRILVTINAFPLELENLTHANSLHNNSEDILEERIIYGRNAADGQFPFMVYLKASGQLCSAFIISKYTVLTAAHCVYRKDTGSFVNPEGVRGCAGSANKEICLELILFRDIIGHPYYSHDTLKNDIAVLKTRQAIRFSHFVKPIRIPPHLPNYFIEKVNLLGWGYTNCHKYRPDTFIDLHDFSDILQYTENMPVVYENIENQRLLCTRTVLKPTCAGDSGSPMIVNIGEEWLAVGILSFGMKPESASCYTVIEDYLYFIAPHIG